MQSVIDIFKTITKIPHCSGKTKALKEYLQTFAKEQGYSVQCDEAGNIVCTKSGSKVTLQSHYDMVCIGEFEQMELHNYHLEGKEYLRAKHSTLGADNGIGIAITLKLMAEGVAVDALFTNDEEIGLVGARALDLKVQTPYLLNLDSEEEGVVTLGCAGGVDLKVKIPLHRVKKRGGLKSIEISGKKFIGGHSGVDIHLDIPNAIKVLAQEIQGEFVSIEGGERRNSIAKRASAELFIADDDADETLSVIENSQAIIDALRDFKHGVREYNDVLDIVESSANLAMLKTFDDYVLIELSLRSMDKAKLDTLLKKSSDFFQERFAVCEVSSEDYYVPWKPQENDFTRLVFEASQKVFVDTKLGAIHAGLECGILLEKMPQVQMASIGPNIHYPHSTLEAVEISSVERVTHLVEDIVVQCKKI